MAEPRWSRWVINLTLLAGAAIAIVFPIIAFGWGYGILAVLAILLLYGCELLIDAVRVWRRKKQDRT